MLKLLKRLFNREAKPEPTPEPTPNPQGRACESCFWMVKNMGQLQCGNPGVNISLVQLNDFCSMHKPLDAFEAVRELFERCLVKEEV